MLRCKSHLLFSQMGTSQYQLPCAQKQGKQLEYSPWLCMTNCNCYHFSFLLQSNILKLIFHFRSNITVLEKVQKTEKYIYKSIEQLPEVGGRYDLGDYKGNPTLLVMFYFLSWVVSSQVFPSVSFCFICLYYFIMH